MDATKDSPGAAFVAGSSAQRALVITQGDPAGLGPELLLRAAEAGKLAAGDRVIAGKAHCEAVVERLERAGASWAGAAHEKLHPLLDPDFPEQGGQYAALVRGVDLVLSDSKAALVTAPIDKACAQAEGLRTPGHTEYLAQRAGVQEFAMAMIGARLRLTLATIHLPLAQVPAALDEAAVVRAGRLLALALRNGFGLPSPRIAVCGLNPHAGEGGLLGSEDVDVVAPAVATLTSELPWASFHGPLPADAAFPLHAQGRYEGIVAMYHDQGLAPFKLLHFSDGVNMTLGLPFVRTSPDHGTAKDIAGRGVADPTSFFEAIRLARG